MNTEPEQSEGVTMKDYRFYASEACEEGERISADKILREIHDSMCMCGEVIDCDTEGVAGTIIEAGTALLATGEWSTDFEDGWIKVETIAGNLVSLENVSNS